MKKMMNLVSIVLTMFLLAGCSQKNNPVGPDQSPTTGKMMFAMDAGSDNIATGTVTLTKGHITQALPITINGYTGTVEFNGIQVGHWAIDVQLFDAQGIAIYSGDGSAIVTKNATTTATIRVQHNTGNLLIIVEVPGLMLWNKLGSEEEVTNSVVGPNLTFSGNATDSIVFESAQYTNGFRSESRWRGVEVPATMLNPTRGCYEMWFKSQVTRPLAYQYGRLQWLNQDPQGAGGGISLVWNDATPYGGTNNSLDVGLGDLGLSIGNFTAEIGRLYHIALVWDVNGIDGTQDTIRVYLDGTLHASTTLSYNPIAGNGVGNIGRIQNTTSGWNDCFGKLTFDNLKIWNYSKTNFSDRFSE